MELVSIIIPNFNKGLFIGETLESVIAQTYLNWEAIIVDDNSTDKSLETIQEYQDKDSRFRFFLNSKEKKGGSLCRNIGIDNSKGKYIIFLDSDDLLQEKCLENRVRLMEQKKELQFAVFPMCNFIRKVGDSNYIWNNFEGDLLNRFLAHDLPWQTMMPIWRKDFILSLGGYNENFIRLQDVELHTRALLSDKLKFETFNKQDADCFFRIDINRVETSLVNLMERRVEGSIQYICFFIDYLQKKQKSKKIKFLKSTLFVILSQIFSSQENREISISERNFLLLKVQKSNIKKIFNYRGTLIIKLYIIIKNKGIKFKGVNYVFNKLLMI